MARLRGQLFARLALDYFDHPKIMVLSAEAIVAHLEMIVYSRRYGTDGAIPMRFAMRFASDVLDELASNDPESPSITRNDDGSVTIHGYADMQETSEQIEARVQVRSEAGKAGAKARWQNNGKSHSGSHSKSHGKSNGKKMAETETETETDINTSSGFAEAHPDAHRALEYLNDRVTQNGFKRPTDTKANRDAARLMFTRDEIPPETIREVMDWALGNEFWRGNIRSFSKLREKFETLQAQMMRPSASSRPVSFDEQRQQRNNDVMLRAIQGGGDAWHESSPRQQLGR